MKPKRVLEELKIWLERENYNYSKGRMMSLSESTWGENITKQILHKIEELERLNLE